MTTFVEPLLARFGCSKPGSERQRPPLAARNLYSLLDDGISNIEQLTTHFGRTGRPSGEYVPEATTSCTCSLCKTGTLRQDK